MAKHDDDNRSNQLNPNNEAYNSSRNYMSDDDDDYSEESGMNQSWHKLNDATSFESVGIEAAEDFIDLTGERKMWDFDLVFMDESGKISAFNMPHYSDEISDDIKRFIKLNDIPYLILLKTRELSDMPRDGNRSKDLVFRSVTNKLSFDAECNNYEEVSMIGIDLSWFSEGELRAYRENVCKINEFVYGGGPYQFGNQNLIPFGGVIPKNIESIHDSMSPIRFKL